MGHPSGTGRHCPLCGRSYVRVEEPPPYVELPAPRHARDDAGDAEVVEPSVVEEDGPRVEVEALAMLSSLASEFDY